MENARPQRCSPDRVHRLSRTTKSRERGIVTWECTDNLWKYKERATTEPPRDRTNRSATLPPTPDSPAAVGRSALPHTERKPPAPDHTTTPARACAAQPAH